jgi:hypothetical protein
MMGVFIPNMDKPKSCAECQFEVIDTSGYPRCVIMQEMVVDGNLFNRCPLEEVNDIQHEAFIEFSKLLMQRIEENFLHGERRK